MVPEPETPSTTPLPSPATGQEDGSALLLPFENLRAPTPAKAAPPAKARWLAFSLTLAAGLLAAMIGYGVGDIMGQSSTWAGVGALTGAIVGAVGVGIVANLTLQAMAEWKSVEHPEGHSRSATEGTP